MNRPMHDMLTAAKGRRAFHMPGHKGRAPFGAEDVFALDTTELPITDDLYCPENGIAEAQRLYAQAAGAAETIFLHNGTTAGIHVMLQLYAGEGDTVLLPRNAHLSAANACILGGIEPVWMPVTQRPDGYCYVAEDTVLSALAAHPEAKAVLLTRPDFYGGCVAMARIVEKARSMGVRVVVDEAHGAHFPWLAAVDSAGALGADAWVQSVHKTLPGLTGSAVLHLRDKADHPRALRLLRREQTSSPSFLLMQSIDDARAFMEDTGRACLGRTAEIAGVLRRILPITGYEDAQLGWTMTGQTFDPTRLVLHAPQGGYALAESLRQCGVDAEMADYRRVVLILTCMDEPGQLFDLIDVLRGIPPIARLLPMLPDLSHLPEKRMGLRAAAMAASENVSPEKAVGRIAASSAGLYPPGIPLVVPGEIIGADVAALLTHAKPQERFGLEGDCLLCVK